MSRVRRHPSRPARPPRWSPVVASIALVLAAVSAPLGAQSAEDWRADLDSLVAQFERRHPAPYHTLPRDSLRAAIARLQQRLPSLDRGAILVELARIMARVGDGHTGIYLPWDTDLGARRFPIEVYYAADGLLVLSAAPAHRDLVGARIVQVGPLPADTLRRRLLALLPGDNAHTPRSLIPHFFGIPAVQRALGAAAAGDTLELRVEDATGATRSVRLAALEPPADSLWHRATGSSTPARWLARRGEAYWFDYDAGSRTIFLQYNRADRELEQDPLLAFGDRLVRTVRERPVDRIVVDLRWNAGGAAFWSNMLLHALVRAEAELQGSRGRHRAPTGKLFAIIGPGSFSQATNFALDLEEHTNAVFVGLPTGGRPNTYGGSARFRLPRTGLTVRHSREWQQNSSPGDTRAALAPDVTAELTTAQFRQGIDPAMEAIMRWRPAPPR